MSISCKRTPQSILKFQNVRKEQEGFQEQSINPTLNDSLSAGRGPRAPPHRQPESNFFGLIWSQGCQNRMAGWAHPCLSVGYGL